jgi:hypothetical protein
LLKKRCSNFDRPQVNDGDERSGNDRGTATNYKHNKKTSTIDYKKRKTPRHDGG